MPVPRSAPIALAFAVLCVGAVGFARPSADAPVAQTGRVAVGPSVETVQAAERYAEGAGSSTLRWDAASGELVLRVSQRPTLPPPAGVRVELAGVDPARLIATAEEAASWPGVVETSVDPSGERVRVRATADDLTRVRDRAAAAAVPVDVAAVQVPRVAAAGRPLVGGGAACTSGFTGTQAGVPVFLTAGHCGTAGTAYSSDGRPAGTVVRTVFPESDYAVGVLDGGVRGVVATADGDVPVRGSVQAPVGATICAMGAASGWTCGPVLATDVTVRYGEGDAAHYVRGLTKVGVCRASGDSGGPWLWGTQAQGLTSGGAGAHGPGCLGAAGDQAAYVQPIGPVLRATGVILDLG